MKKSCQSSDSGLCNTNKQTHLNMLHNCPKAVCNRGYTWRHDCVYFTICHYLTAVENIGFELFPDLSGFKNPKFCLIVLHLISL